jgi:hypothetical protein
LSHIYIEIENKTKIIEQLKSLLHDDSFYVRNTACVALANALEGTADSAAIEELKNIAEEDPNSEVRSTAKVCIKIIKGEPREKERVRFNLLGKETKMDSKYKSEKFDLLEAVDIFHCLVINTLIFNNKKLFMGPEVCK